MNFDQDSYRCKVASTSQKAWVYGRMAESYAYTDPDLMAACLRAHGWRPVR